MANPDSILNYYKKVLKFRKENDIVKYGDFELLDTDTKIFAYIRHYEKQKMLVICSLTDEEKPVRINTADFKMDEAELVLYNYENNPVIHNGFMSRPYETRVYLADM